jgi:hypothetical protein
VLVADRGERVVAQLADHIARELIGAAVRRVEATEDVHERRLARAGRTHDRDELRRVDVEVDAPERMHLDLLADPVRLRDAAQAHDRIGDRRESARERCRSAGEAHRPMKTGPPPGP